MLPHKDYDLQGECIHFHDDIVNHGTVHFHEYVATEDMEINQAQPNTDMTETDSLNIEFWMSEPKYQLTIVLTIKMVWLLESKITIKMRLG